MYYNVISKELNKYVEKYYNVVKVPTLPPLNVSYSLGVWGSNKSKYIPLVSISKIIDNFYTQHYRMNKKHKLKPFEIIKAFKSMFEHYKELGVSQFKFYKYNNFIYIGLVYSKKRW